MLQADYRGFLEFEEDLGAFEVSNDVFALLGDLVVLFCPPVILPRGPCFYLSDEALGYQRPQDALQGVPRDVRLVHDAGGLALPFVNYIENIQPDLQFGSSGQEMSPDLTSISTAILDEFIFIYFIRH